MTSWSSGELTLTIPVLHVEGEVTARAVSLSYFIAMPWNLEQVAPHHDDVEPVDELVSLREPMWIEGRLQRDHAADACRAARCDARLGVLHHERVGGIDVEGGERLRIPLRIGLAVGDVVGADDRFEAGGESGECGVEVFADLAAEGAVFLDEVAAVADGAGALVVLQTPAFDAERQRIVDLAADRRLPVGKMAAGGGVAAALCGVVAVATTGLPGGISVGLPTFQAATPLQAAAAAPS